MTFPDPPPPRARTISRMPSLGGVIARCALFCAVVVGACAMPSSGQPTLGWGGSVDPPLRATIRPGAGDPPLAGRIASWDEAGFILRTDAGEDRTIAWRDLDARQAYELARRLIDTKDASDWLRVGVLMLRADEPALADRAFAVAARLDPATPLIADAARRAHAAGVDPGAALTADPDTLNTTPDRSGANADAGPWPVLTEAQHAAEAARVRRRAQTMVSDAGLTLTPIDTGRFLLFTDLPEREAHAAGEQLERMYRSLLRTLELPADAELFQGRAVVFLLTSRDEFVRLEKGAFGVDPNGAIGMCHLRDADVFVVCHRGEDETAFISTLVHETVHGFMYRYRTPGELPIWANEGLADYIAGFLLQQSQEPARHWTQAKSFVRSGGDPSTILFQSYDDGSWPTRDSYAVGHMLVRHLLRKDAQAMKRWIDAVKDGADWREALKDHFTLTPNQLADDFAASMTKESYYKR